MIKLRHYIFINPHNVLSRKHKKLDFIKKIHLRNYNKGERIIYWFYEDILKLLQSYDKKLAYLFSKINKMYPALLADIGRYIILYKFGGVYLDLKLLAKNEIYKLIYFTKKFNKNIKVIGWKHPKKNRTRNGGIIALRKNVKFFDIVLQNIKKKLLKEKKVNKKINSSKMFYIGSKTYIDLFKIYEKQNKVAKYPFQKNIVKFKRKIYKLNFVRWQNTHQKLFEEKK
jgi:hypothetical protein